jgi:hypothetical protein
LFDKFAVITSFEPKLELDMAVDFMAGIGAFKSMYDAAKALKDMNDATVRNTAVIELQEKILSAREEREAVLRRVDELETELVALKSWQAERERYVLVPLAPNVVAYQEKIDLRDREPSHYLCPNCFGLNKKSFMQQTVRGNTLDRYRCNTCKEELSVHKDGRPQRALVGGRQAGPDGWMGR